MKLTCPLCDSINEIEGPRVAGTELTCAVCGASLRVLRQSSAPVPKASKYDGYNVGKRVLKLAPGWLLLSLAGFVLVFLFLGWLSRPLTKRSGTEEEFRNEALNQTPAILPTPRDARRTGQGALATPVETPSHASTPVSEAGAVETGATPVQPSAGGQESDADFAVQTGSFDDLSQANEQVSRLRAAGFETRVVEKRKEKSEGVWYQVRCGRFATRAEAAQLASQLRAKRVVGTTVIIEPSQQ